MPRLRIYYGWYIVAACFLLCLVFAGAGFYSFSIFIRPLENEFGWDRSAISLAMSIYFIVGGLMGPMVGRLIQSYGPRKVMRISAFGAGACFMLVSLTGSLWYFYLVYAGLAVAIGGIGVIPISTLLSNWFDKRRGTAIGIAMVGISAGGLLLAPVVGGFNAVFGWQGSFLFLGLLVWAVAVPVITFVVKDGPAAGTGDGRPVCEQRIGTPVPAAPEPSGSVEPAAGWPAEAVFRSKAFWCIFCSFVLSPFAQMGVLQHQVPLITDTGVDQATAAAALGITAGVGGLGKLSFGRISEFWPFHYVASLCFGLQALAVLLLLSTQSLAMIWLYAVIFGFGMGGVVVLMPLVVGHFWGLLSYGVILGTLWLANAIGGALGTYASGMIYDHWGSYQYALYAVIAAYLISIVTFFLAGRPQEFPCKK